MHRNELFFHIARNDGLEFVFSSGHALRYPVHTHVSVFTVTVVRKGAVALCRGTSKEIHPAGSLYVLAPDEPHSPTYSDGFDIVSLCMDKKLCRTRPIADVMASFIRHVQVFSEKKLLASRNIQSLAEGIETVFSHPRRLHENVCEPLPLLIDHRRRTDRFRLIRSCKKETGLTPHQYVIQNRIREAKILLAGSVAIADVAGQTSFYDQSHLNRWFKTAIGITPKQYKQSCFNLDSLNAV